MWTDKNFVSNRKICLYILLVTLLIPFRKKHIFTRKSYFIFIQCKTLLCRIVSAHQSVAKKTFFLQFVWKILPFRLLHLDNYSHHLLYQTSRSVQKNRRHFLRRSVKHTLICLCCQGKNTLIDVWWFTPLGKNRTIGPGPWLNTLPVTVTRSKQKWGWIQGVRVHG